MILRGFFRGEHSSLVDSAFGSGRIACRRRRVLGRGSISPGFGRQREARALDLLDRRISLTRDEQ
jgi:hypothetical protein